MTHDEYVEQLKWMVTECSLTELEELKGDLEEIREHDETMANIMGQITHLMGSVASLAKKRLTELEQVKALKLEIPEGWNNPTEDKD